MYDKLTKEQNEKMRYRQIILDERLLRINNMINGRGHSFYRFITDENGMVSHEKINDFIYELMESLERHNAAFGKRELDELTREAYSDFLYYAVCGLIWTNNKRCTEATLTVVSETFADIIDFAADLESTTYSSYDEFLMAVYVEYRKSTSGLPHFFARMQESLRLLGFSDPFLMMRPRENLLELCKKYAEENNISDEENKRYIDEINDWFDDTDYSEQQYEECEEMPSEQLEEQLAEAGEKYDRMKNISDEIDSLGENENYENSELLRGYSSEEMTDFEKWRAENKMLDLSVYWREDIISEKSGPFMENCNIFAALYFSIDRKKMLEDITNMIDTFLFERKLSAFSFGDAYGLVTYQIEKMQDFIEKEIKRAKKIC